MKIESLFLLFFLGCGLDLSAQVPELVIGEFPDTFISLKDHLQVFSDSTRKMTWQEVLDKKNQFKSINELPVKITFKKEKPDYWFYFKVNSTNPEPQKVIIRGFREGDLYFYHLDQERLLTQVKVGQYYPPKNDETKLALQKSDFLTNLQKGENRFLIKRASKFTFHPKEFQLSLFKERLLMAQKDKWLLLFYAGNGLFLGIILFIFVFSLIQFFQNRNPIFITYALYVCCLLFYFSTYFSINSRYFQIFPLWIFPKNQPSNFGIVITFFYYLFLYVALGGSKNKNPHTRVLKILAFSTLVFIISFKVFITIDEQWGAPMEYLYRYIIIFFFSIVVYVLLKSKEKVAKYILLGTASLGSMAIIGFIIARNGAPFWGFWWHKTMTLVQIGVLLELLFFSLGIGYKTRQIEIEKKQAELGLKLKEKETQQLKELDQFKDRFYTNITHELRTPLTVIDGLTKQIQKRPNFKLSERLGLIKNNTQNLIELINQLLDLSKLEAGRIDLNYQQQDLIPYLKFLIESFQSIAFDKKIMLSFYTKETHLWMDFDPEKMKRIIVNLLANALKFTPAYGKVMVIIQTLDQQKVVDTFTKYKIGNHLIINNLSKDNPTYLSLEVKDSGKGISKENLPYIFERFYQVDPDQQLQEGTGLGLALVKELVGLMNGAILVSSVIDEGVSMTLIFPILQQTDKIQSTLVPKKMEPLAQNTHQGADVKKWSYNSHQANILIVEDNKDVIYYLASCLEEHYQLSVARDGQIGLAKAHELLPDLILSDVMMPNMDGFELCHQLKKDRRTAHIPIILLTARTQKADIHQGLKYGADAYLTKPFDQAELLLRIENLLSIREKVKAQILEVQPAKTMTDADAQFLEKLQKTILQNLSKEDFNTPQLCRAMATSRTQLYRKLKALTGFSTADYIQHIRLQKAKILLTTTQLSISEISIQVGFKTPSHFSRAFSKTFGETPSETRK